VTDDTATDALRLVHAAPLSMPALDGLLAVLSKDERARAARFQHPGARAEYISAHALVRAVLARELGEKPHALRFEADTYGKPHLSPRRPKLGFSLAHTHGRVAVLVGEGEELGVDVERIDPGAELESLAARFFAPEEAAAVRKADPAARADRFFAVWTAKEAYVKARGLGLRLALGDFTVRSNGLYGPGGQRLDWQLWTACIEGYALAAVAPEGDAPRSLELHDGDATLADLVRLG
jgi:4'-phosphopantetheinyl transferase